MEPDGGCTPSSERVSGAVNDSSRGAPSPTVHTHASGLRAAGNGLYVRALFAGTLWSALLGSIVRMGALLGRGMSERQLPPPTRRRICETAITRTIREMARGNGGTPRPVDRERALSLAHANGAAPHFSETSFTIRTSVAGRVPCSRRVRSTPVGSRARRLSTGKAGESPLATAISSCGPETTRTFKAQRAGTWRSTALSWRKFLAATWSRTRRSITRTASETTTGLRILNSGRNLNQRGSELASKSIVRRVRVTAPNATLPFTLA